MSLKEVSERGIIYSLALIGCFLLSGLYSDIKDMKKQQIVQSQAMISFLENSQQTASKLDEGMMEVLDVRDSHILVGLPVRFREVTTKLATMEQ